MRFLLFSICLLISSISFAQNHEIKGTVQDTFENPLIGATILLLDTDSIMVDFTSTELNGSFKFEDIESGNYIVKSTYVSYIPLATNVNLAEKDIDMGVLQMTELAEELMAVVIKAAKASIVMRGDTVEYDASTFKVPVGSTVEDLLKRLPGIEVKRDGEILAEGQSVNKVTVDGKSFFGSDPKAATKNLPAEGISKVQVFDSKTEQEEITGDTGESENKTMNLELKEDFKSGGFGKVLAGIGTESTGELKGNYNKFNDKIQFSIVGVGNNTGRNGLGWNDYQDFMGSQSFAFGDGTDYGFAGGGYRTFYFGGGGGGIESSIQSIFFNGSQKGFPENYNGGTNFNFDNKKTKLSTVYFYNQNALERSSTGLSDKFYEDFVRKELSENLSDNRSKGHRGEISLEHKIDSLNTIKIDFNGAQVNQNNLLNGNSEILEDEAIRRQTNYNNVSNMDGYLGSATALLRKSFMKKGRRMGLNVSFLTSELNDNWTQKSDLLIFNENGESSSNFNRENRDLAKKNQFKANALFVEPLSERFFFQTFYNYRNRQEDGEQIVEDLAGDLRIQKSEWSSVYDNTIISNRVGGQIRYSYEGLNMSLGLAYQTFDLNGETRTFDTQVPFTFDDTFKSYIPHASFSYSPVRSTRMGISFGRDVNEPNIEDLKGVIDYTNPNFIKFGNTSLIPEVSNRISANFSRNYVEKGIRFSLRASAELLENGFTISETINPVDLLTEYTPINLDGGKNLRFSSSFNFPIKMNKLTIDTYVTANFRKDPTLVNDLKNEADRKIYTPSITINYTPSNDLTLFIDGRYSVNNTSYSIDDALDQKSENYGVSAELNAKIFAGLFVNTNFDFDRYLNDRFNQEQNISILNASIYKHLLKGNKLELRLSIYDAFNNNVGFFQTVTNLGFEQSTTPTLARYVMMSATYNIRGMKSDIKKNRWW